MNRTTKSKVKPSKRTSIVPDSARVKKPTTGGAIISTQGSSNKIVVPPSFAPGV